jgi:hypothetical protein
MITDAPFFARVIARVIPAAPLPMTQTSADGLSSLRSLISLSMS